MGEYADMCLDGTCCSQCGEFLDIDGLVDGSFEAQGYPGMCAGCAREERSQPNVPRFNRYAIKEPKPRANQIACPDCGKVVKVVGLKHHQLDKHGAV